MEFIEFLVTAAFVLYFIRLLIRLLLPMLFQRVVNKAQQQAGQQQYYQSRKTDNKVHVDYAPKTKSAIPDSEGDFIDYEEIK
jgi:fatty-acid desaturase